jgi:hypothetical protein
MAEQNAFPIPPPFQVSRMATSYWVPQAIHAAAVLGVADALAAAAPPADVARAIERIPARSTARCARSSRSNLHARERRRVR